VRGVKHKPLLPRHRRDTVARHHSAQRQAVAQRLAQRQDVRHHALVLDGEQVTAPAHGRLRLVDDEEHAALLTVRFHGTHIAGRERDHAAGGEDGLEDNGAEGAAGGGVDEGPAVVELGAPVVGAVGMAEGRAVGVGAGQHVHAGHLAKAISWRSGKGEGRTSGP